MKRWIHIGCLSVLLMTMQGLAASTVTLDLQSPSDGLSYRDTGPLTVDWTIAAQVSAGDNMGLACISVDLVQDLFNPSPSIIEPASTIPSEMQCFDLPLGIANPTGGYAGTQVPYYLGAMNVLQIGGAQNTFGGPPTVQPPLATYGLDFDVDGHIGQLQGGQVIAGGSFAGPTEYGVYRFYLDSEVANTLVSVHEPPRFSPVSAADVEMGDTNGIISFVLCKTADTNGDFVVTVDDITAFVDILLETTTADPYSTCATDLNDDGTIDGDDIQAFVDAFLNP